MLTTSSIKKELSFEYLSFEDFFNQSLPQNIS